LCLVGVCVWFVFVFDLCLSSDCVCGCFVCGCFGLFWPGYLVFVIWFGLYWPDIWCLRLFLGCFGLMLVFVVVLAVFGVCGCFRCFGLTFGVRGWFGVSLAHFLVSHIEHSKIHFFFFLSHGSTSKTKIDPLVRNSQTQKQTNNKQ